MLGAEPSSSEIGHSLARLGNYRVLRAQQLVSEHGPVPITASQLLALGLRETDGRNVCGGARLELGKWVQSFSDRGWLQISDQVPENLAWLRSVPGCPNGLWDPQYGHHAAEPMYCPRFTDATLYTLTEMARNCAGAASAGIPVLFQARFCIAAHNAGFSGALAGYRQGDVDLHTARGNYSAWVVSVANHVHQWVVTHPAWVYRGQRL